MTLRYCILGFLFIISANSYSQYYSITQIDSLKRNLIHENGTARVNVLVNLADGYIPFDLDSTRAYVNMAKRETKALKYEWGYYKSLYVLAKLEDVTKPIGFNESKIDSTIQWFRNNLYEIDAIYSELLLVNIVKNTKGREAAIPILNNLLSRSKKHKDKRLIGLIWKMISNCRHGFLSNSFPGSMDSAIHYFGLSHDSINLLTLTLRKNLAINGSLKARNTAKKTLAKAKKWQTKKLLISSEFYQSANYSVTSQFDSTKFHLNQMRNHLENYNNSVLKGDYHFVSGYANELKDSMDIALGHYEKAREIAFRDNNRIKELFYLDRLSGIFSEIGEYEKSISTTLKRLEIAELLDDEFALHDTKMGLADLYVLTNKDEKAEVIYLESIDWINIALEEDVRVKFRGGVNKELGEIYKKRKQYDKAIHYFDLSANDYIKSKPRSAFEVNLLAIETFLDQNKVDSASFRFELIKKDYNSPRFFTYGEFYLTQGRLLVAQQKYKAGSESLEKYLKLSRKIEVNTERQEAYFRLYTAYEELGQNKKALNSYIKYNAIDDSLRANKTIENISEIQSEYEISLKEAIISDMQKKEELQALRLAQQNSLLKLRSLYIIILFVFSLLITVISYLLYRRFRQKKEQEEIMSRTRSAELELENIQTKQKVEIAEIKNTIFANVSHEFRTPLTLIRVPIQNHIEKADPADIPMFNSVLSNTCDLLKMVDELLDVSQMQLGDIELKISVFNISNFFTLIKSNFTTLFNEKNIHFSWSNNLADQQFNGDESRLKIVANNLLKNAYNHTPINGEVSCLLEPLESKDNQGFTLEVTNSGRNISPRDLPFIFERNFRATESDYSGYGIGLSLTKQIVELHQGDITVDNSIPDFVTFKVQFLKGLIAKEFNAIEIEPDSNYFESSTSLRENYNHETKQHRKSHLLVVEDNAEMTLLLKNILDTDFKLTFAENGEVGESMALEQQPDLVLSDIMMPKKDGFELLNSLKNNFGTSHIPVVLLTAKADVHSQIEGLNQNADDYIAKPFDTTTLKVRIKNILRQRQNLQELFTNNPLLFNKEMKCSSLDVEFMSKAQELLEENFQNDEFSTTQFCAELALNRNSVHNKIKAFTNQSTAQYIKNFKLEKASILLRTTNDTVGQISEKTGFKNTQTFNKAFKDKFKNTPSEYRKAI